MSRPKTYFELRLVRSKSIFRCASERVTDYFTIDAVKILDKVRARHAAGTWVDVSLPEIGGQVAQYQARWFNE
jgi:hypothetical protein